MKLNSGVTTFTERSDERSTKWKYIPALGAPMWAHSQRGGTQGTSRRGAHPYRYLALPSPLEIPGPIPLKQIAPYLQLSIRRCLQTSLHLWGWTEN